MFFSNDQLQDAIAEFKDECIDLLSAMETALLEIQEHGMGGDRINAVFRAAHTIKGSAGMLKLDHLVEFTHIAENLLDDIRNDKIAITDEMIGTFLECKDHMQNLVLFYAANVGQQPDEKYKEISRTIMGELQNYSGKPIAKAVAQEPKKVVVAAPSVVGWNVVIQFGKDTLADGMDPAHFIRFLSSMGEVKSFSTELQNIPALSGINPTECYIVAYMELVTSATKD